MVDANLPELFSKIIVLTILEITLLKRIKWQTGSLTENFRTIISKKTLDMYVLFKL